MEPSQDGVDPKKASRCSLELTKWRMPGIESRCSANRVTEPCKLTNSF